MSERAASTRDAVERVDDAHGLPKGDSAREATASLAGFLYQDYRTAIVWLAIGEGEELFVEVAEDYVRASSDELEATQVKHVSRAITLNDQDARDALSNFVDFATRNSSKRVKYVFLTTAAASLEKRLIHRPFRNRNVAGIEYWREVSQGAAISPLRSALEAITQDKKVKQFIAERTDAQLREDLVMRMEWITGAESIEAVKEALTEAVVYRLRKQRIGRQEAKRVVAHVLNHVREVASRSDRASRRLTVGGLDDVIDAATGTWVANSDYDELVRRAVRASNLPIDQLDKYVTERVAVLRSSRHFRGFDKRTFALKLASDVRSDGPYAMASADVRADALAWAARALIDEDRDKAYELLDCALELSPNCSHVRLVEALRISVNSLDDAMQSLLPMHSPEANTMRYLIHRRSGEGAPARAIAWFRASGLGFAELDEDGQASLLEDQMHAGLWDESVACASQVDPASSQHPRLLLAHAVQALTRAVPVGRRDEILDIPPLSFPANFPLFDTADGMELRDQALFLFERTREAAATLGLEFVQYHVEEYVLWLKLARDSRNKEAREMLEARVVAEEGWQQWLPLALASGIEVDLETARGRLDRSYALNRSETFYGARALLALMFASPAKPGSQGWKGVRDRLSRFFDPNMIVALETRALLNDRNISGARAALTELSGVEAERWRLKLEIEIAAECGEDILARREAEFASSDSTADLEALLAELSKRDQWIDIVPRAGELFARVKTLENAERYVYALERTSQWEGLQEFLLKHPELSQRSEYILERALHIRLLLADWRQVRAILDVVTNQDTAVVLAIKIRLLTLSFRWQEFNPLIDAVLAKQDNCPPALLLQLAAIAAVLGRKRESKILTGYAVAAAPADPRVLVSAYLQSTKNPMEGDEASNAVLLKTALDTSAEEGPLVSFSLADVAKLAPQWRKQAQDSWESLRQGAVTMEAYAASVNRRISDVVLAAAVANVSETDLRRRSIVCAFSGARPPTTVPSSSRVAFDPTALLTLARLDLLAKVREMFGTIYVPYHTGAWLLEELQNVDFHQPKRIEDADDLLILLGRGAVSTAPAPERSNASLAREVGAELADLLLYAKHLRESGEDAFVIRSAPVPVVSSMLERNADLSDFGEALRSFRCLVDTLSTQGILNASDAENARAYAANVDNAWAWDRDIPDGSTLLLDELSVTYLQGAGLLSQLASSGFVLSVHKSTLERAKAYDSVKETSNEVRRMLSSLADFISSGISEHVVEVLPAPIERWSEKAIAANLTVDLIEPRGRYDALVVDDRFLNRFTAIRTVEENELTLHCTLDVLDMLRNAELVSLQEWRSHRTELRRSGYCHIPVLADELDTALAAAQVKATRLVETVELRAIRENVALAQLRGTLALPLEAQWLTALTRSCDDQIEGLLTLSDRGRQSALLSWVLELTNVCRFGNSLPANIPKEGLRILGLGPFRRIVAHCMAYTGQDPLYTEFIDGCFESMRWQRPADFHWIRDETRNLLCDMRDKLVERSTAPALIAALLTPMVERLPQSLRAEILRLERLDAKLGIPIIRITQLNFEEQPQFEQQTLWSAAAEVLATGDQVSLKDVNEGDWILKLNVDKQVCIVVGEQLRPLPFEHLALAADDASVRVDHFTARCYDAVISAEDAKPLLGKLASKPFTAAEADDAIDWLESYPLPRGKKILNALANREATNGDFFPDLAIYYERLVGPWRGEERIEEFAEARSQPNAGPFSAQLKQALLSSGHVLTTPTALIENADEKELRAFVTQETPTLDIWSIVALLNGIMLRADAHAELLDIVALMLGALCDLLAPESHRLELARVLFEMSDARIAAIFVDKECPGYWRHLAAIAHAATLERACLESGTDLEHLIKHIDGLNSAGRWTSAVDMQREPHWSPMLLVAQHFRFEFYGRIVGTWLTRFQETQAGIELGEQWRRLEGVLGGTLPISLPGPVEGNSALPELPEVVAAQFDEVLTLTAAPLVNRWLVYSMWGSAAQVPAASLRTLQSQIEEEGRGAFDGLNSDERCVVLAWLAIVAASNRDTELADAVTELARGMSPDNGAEIPAIACLYIGLVCAAAEQDRAAWRVKIAECSAFAAHAQIDKEEAKACRAALDALSNADWALQLPLARAFVATSSLLQRR